MVELADFTETKNTHSENGRVGRLRREKCQRMRILKEREFQCCCSAERTEAIAIQCTFVMPIPREKNRQSLIVFSNVLETFPSMKQCSLQSFQSLPAASFRSRRFPKPRSSTVFRRAQKNTSEISRKSTENRMTKRMSFIKSNLKSAKSKVFCRKVPKE